MTKTPYTPSYGELLKQRDDLLEALRECAAELNAYADTSTLPEDHPSRRAYERARATILRITGSQE